MDRRYFLKSAAATVVAFAASNKITEYRATEPGLHYFDAAAYVERWMDDDPFIQERAGKVVRITCWLPETTPNGWNDLPAYRAELNRLGRVYQA